METLAGQNEPEILDDFLATFSHQVANQLNREEKYDFQSVDKNKSGAGTCWRAEHGKHALHGDNFF